MRHIIPISGKDSLWTAIIQKRRQPNLPYEYLYNPTGMELPEIESWLSQVEQYLDIEIQRIGDDLGEIIREQKILPAHKTRYCTRLAKIFPMQDWIGREEATVYYGIRADERRVGYQSVAGGNITPVYPLQEEGQALVDVWRGVTGLDLLPPQFFWKSMYEMVIKRLGTFADILSTFEAWERVVVFARRTRPNCHMCFYQRLSEWVGLLEHHPDLFWQDAELEESIGAKGYSFKQGWPLRKIAQHAEDIKRKRCKQICAVIAKRAQTSMLDLLELEDPEDTDPDLLNIVPCGLFCGK